VSARPTRSIRLSDAEPEEDPPMMMTSMIDVIFILLAFFVCVSELKKGHLDVEIPKVSDASAESSSSGDPIVVEVTGDDRVSIGGEVAASDDELARLIAQAVERLGVDAPVHLSGDRSAKNGTMMKVVSHLSRAGLKKIEFAVESGG
jgi:biopolymer transport protein ExbD